MDNYWGVWRMVKNKSSWKLLSYWIIFYGVLLLLLCIFRNALEVDSKCMFVLIFVIIFFKFSVYFWWMMLFLIRNRKMSLFDFFVIVGWLFELGDFPGYVCLFCQILKLSYVSLKNNFLGFVFVCTEKFSFWLFFRVDNILSFVDEMLLRGPLGFPGWDLFAI